MMKHALLREFFYPFDDELDWMSVACAVVGVFCFAVLTLFGIAIYQGVRFLATHDCVEYSAPYEHPGTVVMAGKVPVSIPGDTYSDCVAWRAK